MQFTDISLRCVEETALNAWPALNSLLYDGWILRFANGYTKRANSVTPLYGGSIDLAQKINFCEKVYQAQHLPPIFRLTTIMDEAGLDEQLEDRNYRRIDPTQVQTLMLDQASYNFSAEVSILKGEQGIKSWLAIFHKLNKQREDAGTHEKMLHNIIGRIGPMIVTIKGSVVACGLGVQEGPYLGLFDIVTGGDQRRKGYATILTQSLLAWGQGLGARYAYLQVMENNEAAIRLYARLGFQTAYRYWYRVGT